MNHGKATPRLKAKDPKAERIAELSDEYLSADPERRYAIGEEVVALMTGGVLAFGRGGINWTGED